jgi:hypothetical protein
MIELLKSSTFWSAIAAISAMVATLAAFYSIKISKESAKAERLSKRAYFTISNPGVKKLSNSPPYRIQITLENVGHNPAVAIAGKILFIDKSMEKPPDSEVDLSISNEVPSNSPTPWYYDNLHLPENMPPKFIVVSISYKDPILEKEYDQQFYMKWHGVKNNVTDPNFVHTSIEESERLLEYLQLKKFL